MWKFSYLFKNWHIDILHSHYGVSVFCVICGCVLYFALIDPETEVKFALNRGLKRVWFLPLFSCIFNSIRPSVVAVFLCCEYIVGLIIFCLWVYVLLIFNKFARRSRWMRVKYAPRKNGFLICSKKGFPFKSGWDVL